MNGWLKFPVSDIPGFIGFFLLTVASVAIAKQIPGVKRLV